MNIKIGETEYELPFKYDKPNQRILDSRGRILIFPDIKVQRNIESLGAICQFVTDSLNDHAALREENERLRKALEYALDCGRGSSGRIIIEQHQEEKIREVLER